MSHYYRISTYSIYTIQDHPCWCQRTLFYHWIENENPHHCSGPASFLLLLFILVDVIRLKLFTSCAWLSYWCYFRHQNQFWQWRWIEKLNNQRRICYNDSMTPLPFIIVIVIRHHHDRPGEERKFFKLQSCSIDWALNSIADCEDNSISMHIFAKIGLRICSMELTTLATNLQN